MLGRLMIQTSTPTERTATAPTRILIDRVPFIEGQLTTTAPRYVPPTATTASA